MSAITSHPLAAAYFRDLDLLLRGLDPGLRAEVLNGVREHLTAAVGPNPTDRRVRAALSELGPAESIADEAYAGQSLSAAAAVPTRVRWQAVVACALNAASLAFVALTSMVMVSGPLGVLGVAPLLLVPWAAVVALSLLTPVWTSRQKAASVALAPATVTALAVVVAACMAAWGPSPINVVPVLAILAASVWVLVRLGRHALR